MLRPDLSLLYPYFKYVCTCVDMDHVFVTSLYFLLFFQVCYFSIFLVGCLLHLAYFASTSLALLWATSSPFVRSGSEFTFSRPSNRSKFTTALVNLFFFFNNSTPPACCPACQKLSWSLSPPLQGLTKIWYLLLDKILSYLLGQDLLRSSLLLSDLVRCEVFKILIHAPSCRATVGAIFLTVAALTVERYFEFLIC